MKKSNRVLDLFYRLLRGERVNRTAFAEEYEMSERSVERDMRTIRGGWAGELFPQSWEAARVHRDGSAFYREGVARKPGPLQRGNGADCSRNEFAVSFLYPHGNQERHPERDGSVRWPAAWKKPPAA